MSDPLEFLSRQMIQNPMLVVAGFAAVIAGLLFVLWRLLPVKAWYRQRVINRRIRESGDDMLQYIVIPDGLGGEIYIEYLVLTGQGVVIYEVVNYKGVIFAADNIDTWTQVVGKRSYKFPNPLPELEAKVMAVRWLAPGLPVTGYLLVADSVAFPKGKPEQLLPLGELDKTESRRPVAGHPLQAQWEKIQAVSRQVDPGKYH